MKQGFLIIAVLGLALGCSEDPQAAEQAEAARTFDQQAMAHFRNISGGYIADSDALRVQQTLEEYQGQERSQAIEALRGLLDKGSDAQQVSAAVALADLYAQQAREQSQAGLQAWTQLASTGHELQVKADAARRRQIVASGLETIDNSEALAEARGDLDQLNEERQAIDDRMETLESEIAEQTEARREFMEQREAAKQRADELRARSYDAERQTRFDLQVEAAEHTREADRAGLEAEKLSLRIDRLKGQLAVARGKRAEIDARIEGVEAVIDQHNQGNRERAEQIAQRRQAAEAAAEEVVNGLQSMAETFKADVADRFDQAEQAYQQAIEVLQQAQSKASGPLRLVLALELGTRQNGYGQTLRQFAAIRTALSNQLFTMANRAGGQLPEPAGSTIIEMAQAARERTDSVRRRATETLEEAAETLEGAEEQLSGRSQFEGIAEAARGQIDAARQSLAALNDQTTAGDPSQFTGGGTGGSASGQQPGPSAGPNRDAIAALNAGEADPAQTVEAIAHQLAQGRTEVLWTALPPRYQDDLTEVVRAFGEAVDPEVYDRAFALVGKLADLLDDQRELILNHPMVQMSARDPRALQARWDSAVSAIRTLTGSPIASAEGLRTIDLEAFARDDVSTIMQQFSATADAAVGASSADFMRVSATVVNIDGDTATVEVTSPTGMTERERMMRVDGRWVPAEMAQAWDAQMEQARGQIAMLRQQGIPNKPQVMGVMSMIDSTLDQLAAAESQDEFNQAVDQIMQQVGPMMMPGPMGPGGGPGGPGGMPGGPDGSGGFGEPMEPDDMPEPSMPDRDTSQQDADRDGMYEDFTNPQ